MNLYLGLDDPHAERIKQTLIRYGSGFRGSYESWAETLAVGLTTQFHSGAGREAHTRRQLGGCWMGGLSQPHRCGLSDHQQDRCRVFISRKVIRTRITRSVLPGS